MRQEWLIKKKEMKIRLDISEAWKNYEAVNMQGT